MRDSLADAVKSVLKAASRSLTAYEVFERMPDIDWVVYPNHVQNYLKQNRKRKAKWLNCERLESWRYSIKK